MPQGHETWGHSRDHCRAWARQAPVTFPQRPHRARQATRAPTCSQKRARTWVGRACRFELVRVFVIAIQSRARWAFRPSRQCKHRVHRSVLPPRSHYRRTKRAGPSPYAACALIRALPTKVIFGFIGSRSSFSAARATLTPKGASNLAHFFAACLRCGSQSKRCRRNLRLMRRGQSACAQVQKRPFPPDP